MVERPDLHRSGDEALWAAVRTECRMIVTQDVSDFALLAANPADDPLAGRIIWLEADAG